MALELTGKELQALQDALVEAFPTRAKLEQLIVGIDLILNLEDEAGAELSLRDAVWNVIKFARAAGALEKLIDGATREQRNNTKLKAFAQRHGRPIDSAPHVYLSPASFDLTRQEEVWRQRISESRENRMITFFMVRCEADVLENLAVRLGHYLDSRRQPFLRKVSLQPLIANIEEVVSRARRWRQDLQTHHVIALVMAEQAEATALDRFFAATKAEFAGVLNRHLVLVINAQDEWKADDECVLLENPKFERWQLNDWVKGVSQNQEWSDTLRNDFGDWLESIAMYEGVLTAGGAYDALQRAIEMLARNPDEQTLRQFMANNS